MADGSLENCTISRKKPRLEEESPSLCPANAEGNMLIDVPKEIEDEEDGDRSELRENREREREASVVSDAKLGTAILDSSEEIKVKGDQTDKTGIGNGLLPSHPKNTDTNLVSEAPKEKEEDQSEVLVESQVDGEISDTEEAVCEAKLGPALFTSSLDMFNFFYDLLQGWPLNININKYEHLMLEELIMKGHPFPERVLAGGIKAFQVRYNPIFYSRSYYVIRPNGSATDFSYKKCIGSIMRLPKEFRPRVRPKKKNKARPRVSMTVP